jgi:hypothetical protein
MQQGETEYSKLNPRFGTYAQKDWSAGRGFLTHDEEKTGYYDAFQMNTLKSDVLISGPKYHFVSDNSAGNIFISNWERSGDNGKWQKKQLIDSANDLYYAAKVEDNNDLACDTFELILGIKGGANGASSDPGTLKIELVEDNGGDPDTVLKSATLTGATFKADVEKYGEFFPFMMYRYQLSFTLETCSSLKDYWIVAYISTAGDADSGWYLLSTKGGTNKSSTDKLAWASTDYGQLYRLRENDDNVSKVFFENYYGVLHYTRLSADFSQSWLFSVGRLLSAKSGSTASVVQVQSGVLTAGEYDNAIAEMYGDMTSGEIPEQRNMRYITSTGTTGLDFTGDVWRKTPQQDTIFGIVGTEVTNLIAQPGSHVSDMKAVHGALYIPRNTQLGTEAIRRVVFKANNNSFSISSLVDNANYYDLIYPISRGRTTEIWAAKCMPAQIAMAYAEDWTDGAGSDLDFTAVSDFDVGDKGVRIKSIIPYGQSYPRLHVMKEDIPHEILNDLAYEVRIPAVKELRDWRNYVGVVGHGKHLYAGFHEGMFRYYDEGGEFEIIGPDIRGPEGMPENRRGYFSDLVSYGPYVIGAYTTDASDGYSCILCWNGQGWHELFRSEIAGERITGVGIQVLPGKAADRLYFDIGSNIAYMDIDTKYLDGADVDESTEYHYYNYIWSGYWISGWMYMGLRKIPKFFKEHGISWDIVSDQKVYLYYQTDDDSTWTYVGVYSSWDDLDLDFSSTHQLSGKRIRVALVFENDINSQAIKVYESSVDAAYRFPEKNDYVCTVILEDSGEDLNGEPDPQSSALAKYQEIETCAGLATPILVDMNANVLKQNTYMHVQPASLEILSRFRNNKRETIVAQFTLQDI